MLASIDLFEALKTRFGEQEAKVIVREIEKIENDIDAKVEKEFDRKTDILATKEDIALLKESIILLEGKMTARIAESKVDLIKWMVTLFVAMILAIIGLYFKH